MPRLRDERDAIRGQAALHVNGVPPGQPQPRGQLPSGPAQQSSIAVQVLSASLGPSSHPPLEPRFCTRPAAQRPNPSSPVCSR